MTDALRELREKVEAGEFEPGKFNAFCDIAEPALENLPAISKSLHNRGWAWDAYNGSLDAAKTLYDVVLPGWGMVLNGGYRKDDPVGQNNYGITLSICEENGRRYASATNDNPARAWLIAILKALEEQSND